MNEIQQWIENPQRDYTIGVALFAKYSFFSPKKWENKNIQRRHSDSAQRRRNFLGRTYNITDCPVKVQKTIIGIAVKIYGKIYSVIAHRIEFFSTFAEK